MKAIAKCLFHCISTFLVLPFIIVAMAEKVLSESESLYQGASQLLSIVPFRLGTYFRAAFYSTVCTSVHREVAVGFMTLFSHRDTTLGSHVYIGSQCNIGSCSIGRDCLLGSGVHVLSGKNQHDFSDPDVPIRLQGGHYSKISVGENCWIGNHATIMADVGDCCIVAAGSVVVDSVPARSIVAGNPARVLKSR